jgi:glycosyltransferase involved in cell wall biosynthesis
LSESPEIEISVVIPVYNSEETIAELARQIDLALSDMQYEVILVNDASIDQSWPTIRQITALYRNVSGINLRKNSGQDNAIMAGLSCARGAYVVIMDDDLQHSPFDIKKLYEKCKQGSDVCYARFPEKKQSWWKNIGSWINGEIAAFLMHKPRHIYLSPFQMIVRPVVKEILRYQGPFPYIQGLILQITDNVSQVETEHHTRKKGSSNYNVSRSARVLLTHITNFSVIPLRISSLIGFCVAITGFILAFVYLLSYFFLQRTVEGWTTLIMTTLVLGGLILMCIGVVGEYLGRVYLSINNKPMFSIKEIIKPNG